MKRALLLSPDGSTSAGEATPPAVRQITAKMKSWNDPARNGNTERVELNAVYAEQGVNKSWATSTPSGQLVLSIDNPRAQGFFKKNVEYIITIREAQPGE